MLVRSELALAHQFRTLITWDFRELVCAPSSPRSHPAYECCIEIFVRLIGLVILVIYSEISGPAVGTENML